ncbi:MAG TPA: cytidine deaminase, partial [Gemmatimonadaceae bacterium]|nr:cytidine deaminase [Gemmatimonadaceae bacterium]
MDERSREALIERAHAAMARAYAPYSRFRVGAALLTADGRTIEGCNVENASFPVSLCAERAAIGAAVSAGAREFVAIAIATEAERPTPPCGMCRQALAEFAPSLVVISVTADGQEARWTIDELLPTAFTPAWLDRT